MMSFRPASIPVSMRTDASVEIRRYGAPMLSCTTMAGGDASASLIERGPIRDVEQRFRLPRHVFRLAVAGAHEHGSTTRLGDRRPVPFPSRVGYVSFYRAGTDIVNTVVGTTSLTYLTVEVAPTLAAHPDAIDETWLHSTVDLQSAKAQGLLRDIARELVAPGPASRLFLEASALLLTVEAARSGPAFAARTPTRGHPQGLSARQLARIEAYLSTHMCDEVSLSALAAEIDVSPSHLCRAFRRSTGTTPHRWTIDRRLDRAKTLMLESDAKLADIAVAVGFYDQAHFTSTFRTRFGVTPRAWRRDVRL